MEVKLTWRTLFILSAETHTLMWWRVISPTSLKGLGETGLKITPLNYLLKFILTSHMPETADRCV